VGYARRNYMVPLPEAESLEELNRHLWEQCMAYGDHRMAGRDRTVNELYEEEEAHLLTLPAVPFTNIETYSGPVDKYATVIVDKNRYSVPTRYVGLKVEVIASIDYVEIFKGGAKIGRHRRVYGNNKWQLDPFHYLELLYRRPQAFRAARPIRQWRQHWPPCLEKLLERFCRTQGTTRGSKDFIQVLLFFKNHDQAEVMAAVEKAVSSQVSTSASVAHLLFHSRAEASPMVSLEGWLKLSPPDLSVYSQIGGER
jgi:hypothetical protein